ncbi:ATP-dependent RNA helicase DBP8 [Kwoniella mangroviensis CBS 10435]|uniref:ATP-dependent RNA helicase DBP8 n=1 Tax=Kwoniella mangroviensis CBS 10435 TaxID=1331196 RepID=A0A1B9IYI6_9TREE|nr:ATP-dependent RNA helicase DBP8 [Kwoniella mangroviensis CBS 10435]
MTATKKATSKRLNGDQEATGLILDQNEVLKAMMAAQKGKAKEVLSEDEDGDEEEDAGFEADSEEDSEDEVEAHSSEDEGSEASSSNTDINSKRGLKRSRDSEDDGDEGGSDEDLPIQTSNTASTSRINLSSRISTAVNGHKTPQKSTIDPSAAFTANPKPSSDTTFASLGLSQPLITALGSINIHKPTEIQAACVGPILSGRDCIGGAKTGSGKTMAFALPIVERIARDPFGVWAVVLTPTRELAYQLSEQFLVVGKPLGLTTATIVGGMDMMTQAQQLEARPQIIVATPGRLCDLLRSDGMSQGKLSRVKTLVLDEADRLLTPTFAPELAYLFSQIPPKRQTCLFTATVSEAIMELANKSPAPGKEKPFVYRVESDTLTVSRLKQKYLFIPSQIRDPYLLYLLQHPPEDIDIALRVDPKKNKSQDSEEKRKKGKKNKHVKIMDDEDENENIPSTIIFTQRCATAHLLHLLLNQLEIPSVALHSHLSQPQRLLSLARFRAQEVKVLVTTDVGSRGLDIPEVAMVVNWDCPRRSDDYIHRVGRTARAGRGGVAITVITERDVELVKMIEDDVKVKLQELTLPEDTVLESMNKVALARRMATMEMHDSGFGERQAINKAKAVKRMKRDAASKAN